MRYIAAVFAASLVGVACADTGQPTSPTRASGAAASANVMTAQGKTPPPPTGFTKVQVVANPSIDLPAGQVTEGQSNCPAGTVALSTTYDMSTVPQGVTPPVVVAIYPVTDNASTTPVGYRIRVDNRGVNAQANGVLLLLNCAS